MSLDSLETRRNPITFSKVEFEEVFHRCFNRSHRETFRKHGAIFLKHLKGVLSEEGIDDDLVTFLTSNPEIAEKVVNLMGYKAGQRGQKRHGINEPGKLMLESEARAAIEASRMCPRETNTIRLRKKIRTTLTNKPPKEKVA